MITCPNCSSNKVIKAGTREDRLGQVGQRYLCHSCGRKFTQRENKKFDSEFRFNDLKYVITSAQNNTVIHKDFFKSLLMYCEVNKARLIVLPSRYLLDSEEANWDPVLLPYMVQGNFNISKKLRVLGGINLLPTIENPLMGLDYLSKGDSLIVGHPQLQMKSLAVNSTDSAAILTTTGTITKPNYSKTKQGLKAEFNHSYSAVVIERESDIFHYRTLNADDSGGFYDINGYYTEKAFYPDAEVDALILGDTHSVFIDPEVKAATFTNEDSIVNTLKPKNIVHHDLLDAFAISHHHRSNFFTRYGKHLAGLDSIEKELNGVIDLLRETTPPSSKLLVVASNHNDHLTKWLNEADPKFDVINAKIYHYLMYLMLEGAEHRGNEFSFPNPFELWLTMNAPELDLQFIGRRESYKIHNIEISNHGDQGSGGSRGSIKGYSRLAHKQIIGHSHTPGIEKGCFQTGTSSKMRLEYNFGPSSWRHTHCIIFGNGKRMLINIVEGKWHS